MGPFIFNPEWDILYITAKWPAKDTLIAFIHRLKTIHDPRLVGLLDLAIAVNGLNGNDVIGVKPSEVDLRHQIGFCRDPHAAP